MYLGRRQLLAASAAGLASLSLSGAPAFARDLPAANPKSLGFDAERLKRIGAAMQRRIDAGEAPGFITAIMRAGKIVHFDVRGVSNVATQEPLRRDTIFRIMSMTKPIVSLAAMILVEENKLRLTDPVAKFIPSFAKSQVYVSGEGDGMVTAPAKRQVQVRNLLSHTAGYTYGVFANTPVDKLHFKKMLFVPAFKTVAEFCEAAATMPLMFEPGTNWNYGISTDILGHVVELVAGQPLGDFLQQRIFGPLGMAYTAFYLPPEKRARFISPHKKNPDGPGLVTTEDFFKGEFIDATRPQSGGGGLVGTADDYLRFCAMLLNEGELDGVRIVGPQTVQLMRANHLPKGVAAMGAGFGLGFGVDEEVGSRSLYGGPGSYFWAGASRTHFWVDPTYKIVGLLMTQMDPFDLYFEEDMRALTYQAFMG